MGLNFLYTAILTYLKGLTDSNSKPLFKHVHVWNNELQLVKAGKEVLYPYPWALPEIDQEPMRQLGNGDQELECTLKIHIIHSLLHAGEDYDQNLEVFDLCDILFQKLQKYKIIDSNNNITTELIRESQTQDFNHEKSLYHFIQSYKFLIIDNLMDEPVNRIIQPFPTVQSTFNIVKSF